jgi:hypothetical protein
MVDRTAQSRQKSLQQAASMMFALVGIVPLLVFAYTLWEIGAIHRSLAQASLGLTLALMLLGFWLFRSLLARMSEIVSGLTRVVEQAERASAVASASARAAARRPAAVSATGETPAPAASPFGAPPAAHPAQVPGFGAVRELGELARTMDLLWQREARVHVGRRVQISVANSEELTGRLVEATAEGLLLEPPGGGTIAIPYGRVQGIEAVG